MSARSLSAGKDNAYNLLLRNGSVRTFLESDLLFTVGIGEQRFDLLLISAMPCLSMPGSFGAYSYLAFCKAEISIIILLLVFLQHFFIHS